MSIRCVFGFHKLTPYTGIRHEGMYPYKGCACGYLEVGPTPIDPLAETILDIDEHLKVHRNTLTEEQRWDLMLAKQQRELRK
jgi:hypothetical protein